MGVCHFIGLGLNPGAVTSPLAIIYLLLKAEELGSQKARDFFKYSGEHGQERKGAPEYLLIFTSKEVINGREPENPNPMESRLFPNKKFKGRITKILHDYLSTLSDALGYAHIYSNGWIKKIYLIQVEFLNFNDCYTIANTITYSCREKECWVNAQAGSNQINVSLAISSSLNLIAGRYYYIKQTQRELLDPKLLEPDAIKHPEAYVDKLLDMWGELMIFGLGINDVIRKIDELFKKREKINRSELEKILEEHNLGRMALKKFEPYLKYDRDAVSKTELFDRLIQIYSNRWTNVNNFSDALRVASEKAILYELDIKSGVVERVQK